MNFINSTNSLRCQISRFCAISKQMLEGLPHIIGSIDPKYSIPCLDSEIINMYFIIVARFSYITLGIWLIMDHDHLLGMEILDFNLKSSSNIELIAVAHMDKMPQECKHPYVSRKFCNFNPGWGVTGAMGVVFYSL